MWRPFGLTEAEEQEEKGISGREITTSSLLTVIDSDLQLDSCDPFHTRHRIDTDCLIVVTHRHPYFAVWLG